MLQRSEWLDLHLHLLAEGPRHQSVRPLALGQDPEAVLAEQVHDGDGVMLGLLAARLLVHVPQLRRGWCRKRTPPPGASWRWLLRRESAGGNQLVAKFVENVEDIVWISPVEAAVAEPFTVYEPHLVFWKLVLDLL